MKHTIIAVVLILILIAAITVNIFYVYSVTENMLDMLGTLPESEIEFPGAEENEVTIDEMLRLWKDSELFFSASICSEESIAVHMLLMDLKTYYKSSDFTHFSLSLQKLDELLKNIKEAELPIIKSVL